ncbi:unnamed protein product [Symbiodinium sp. CCMP2592]|nr:unnamed protein product [Symbiodinium sp. CCMP2592]
MWMCIQQPSEDEARRDADPRMSELLKEELVSLRNTLMREIRQMLAEQIRDIRLLVKDSGSSPEVDRSAPDICSFALSEEISTSDSPVHAAQFEIDSEYDDFDWSQVEAGFTEAADGGDEDQDEGFSSPEKVPLV